MKSKQLILVTAVSLLFSVQAIALSTDRDQPADIEADDIEFDFKKGIRTYTKNVIIVQGTLRIKADKLITLYQDGELTEATATGSLARFKQRPDGKPDDVEGSAKKIVVDQKKNILTLYGQAALQQGGDTARGETIIYNMATDTLKVQGGAKVATVGADGQAAPVRKLEDPFKDDPAPAVGSQAHSAPVAALDDEENKEDDEDSEKSNEEQAPVPIAVPAGRSRLIIQPK